MPPFNRSVFFRSFRYAAKGLAYAFRYEQSFRVQLSIAIVLVAVASLIGVSPTETLILTLVVSSILVLELLNTILEKFLDILKPRMHPFVGLMKDLMAAAVFVAALGALVIGAVIFFPRLL